MAMMGSAVKPMADVGLMPWKKSVTGPIDESLFGTLSSSALPSSRWE